MGEALWKLLIKILNIFNSNVNTDIKKAVNAISN